MTNEKNKRAAGLSENKSNEQIFSLLYQLNREVEELSLLVRSMKREYEGSDNQ